jgi:UDP-N-acetylglucosamine 2-epimerase (non-hydrolysing)
VIGAAPFRINDAHRSSRLPVPSAAARILSREPIGPKTAGYSARVLVFCIAAARPNFMKIKPVLDALTARDIEVDLVHTGQHYDGTMSDVFFDELGIRPPDHHLGVGSGTHAEQTGRVMAAMEPLIRRRAPDVVVVVGDVNSTMAAAIVAAKAGSLVAHVEAGLRSRDWSMPEEVNRVVTDRLSDYLFAPSPDAVENLRNEGYRDDQIHLVGNVMVDTLLRNVERARRRPVLADLGVAGRAFGLVTLHRPANVDDPVVLKNLLGALDVVSETCELIFPVHPRTRRAIEEASIATAVRLVEPLGYLDFLALQAAARVVLTDSGGVQEETTALGVPCLTLRDNTERPITVTEGTNVLVGRDPERIIAEARLVLARTAPGPGRRPALWDGRAGERIAAVILAGGGPAGHARPTDHATTPPD